MVVIRDFPQRIALPSYYGELMKRLDGVRAVVRMENAERDPAYLAMVRQCPCIKCGMEPCGECHHVRLTSAAYGKRGSMGKRVPDRWAICLCGDCHRVDADALHAGPEIRFWHRLRINPLPVCQRLYAQRGDIVAMRAVIIKAISERGTTE